MKKIIAFLMMAALWLPSLADEPKRVSINAGIFAPYTLDATLGYELPVGYGKSISIFAEGGNHWQTPVCHMFWKKYFWDGGLEYKHRIVRYKNGSLRLFGGVYCGAWIKDFYFGCHIGIEYNYTFANNWQISISQKDKFNFLHGDLFSNGLIFGVKIPF